MYYLINQSSELITTFSVLKDTMADMLQNNNVPWGTECLRTNVVFVNATQDFIFHFSLCLFSRQFSRDIYLRLNIEAGALYV